jgi:Tol biopolymer transport system component
MHAFLLNLLIFFNGGCQEYNIQAGASEVAALSQVIQLTDQFDRAGQAFFSPDARWIAFRAVAHGQHQYQLFLAKTVWNQSEMTGIEKPICITPKDSRSEGGSFSNDELTLIFSSTAGASVTAGDKYPPQMRIFRADGWEGALSMTDFNTGINLARHPVLGDAVYNAQARFSPDSQHIVFTSTRSGHPNLFVMHPDGTHVVQLTKTAGADDQASFSPDGKHLVYCSVRDANHFEQVYVGDLAVDKDGEITGLSAERALTYDENNNLNPCWFNDSKHIIYATSRHGASNYELYLMVSNGRQKTRITYSPGADLFPVFSPDGRYVMWTSKRAKDGSTQIFLAKFQFPLGA